MTAEPAPPQSPAPLLSLQVLRAVAATLVLVHHAGYDADTIAARTGAGALALDRFLDFGFGVHLFFVISGFIMLRTARGFGSVRGAAIFMARRVVRVVPLYWLMTSLVLLGAALAPGLLNTPPGGFAWVAGSYFFFPVTRPDGLLQPVLGQGWTLEYEMFFYVFFAAAMLLPRRAALPTLTGAFVGLVVFGRAVATPAAAITVWTDGLLLEFLFGLGIAAADERGWRLGRGGASALVALGCGAAILMGPASNRFDALATWAREGLPGTAIVAGCVLGPRWAAGRAVLAAALVGDASYSLYLSHPFAVRALRGAWLAVAPSDAPLVVYVTAACAAAVGAALLLHRGVERPMTDWLQRRSRIAGAIARPILPEAAHAAEPPSPGLSPKPAPIAE